jgi:hypothetical protein
MPVKLTAAQLSGLNASPLSFIFSFTEGTYDVNTVSGKLKVTFELTAEKKPETGGIQPLPIQPNKSKRKSYKK